MSATIRRYAWAAAAWILILGAAEMSLRALGVRMAGSNYASDPLTGVGLRPGAKSWATNEGVAWSEINSRGYRDVERSLEKSPKTVRVAVLGDSITEARQVRQDLIFTRLMEKDLDGCPALDGRDVEVLNFAVPGFGTAQEYLTLHERVWDYDPDIVVLVFYSGNDIFDNHPRLRDVDANASAYYVLRDGKLVLDDSFRQSRRYRPWYRFLKDAASDALNSSVFALTLYETRLRLMSLTVRRPSQQRSAAPADSQDGVPLDYTKHWFYAPPEHPAMKSAWEVTEALLTAMHEETRAHSVPFLLIGMPTAEQLHPDENVRREIRDRYGLDTLDYPEQRLAAWAERVGTPFLDAGPPLRDYAVREQAYLNGFANTKLGTGHLNELGHRVVSKLFSERVCEALAGPNVSER